MKWQLYQHVVEIWKRGNLCRKFLLSIFFFSLTTLNFAEAKCFSWMEKQEFLCSNSKIYIAGSAKCEKVALADQNFANVDRRTLRGESGRQNEVAANNIGLDSKKNGKFILQTSSLILCPFVNGRSLHSCLNDESRDNNQCMREYRDFYSVKRQIRINDDCLSNLRILRDIVLKKYLTRCQSGGAEEITRLAHLASYQLNKNRDVVKNCSLQVRNVIGKKILRATLSARDTFQHRDVSKYLESGSDRCVRIARFLTNVLAKPHQLTSEN